MSDDTKKSVGGEEATMSNATKNNRAGFCSNDHSGPMVNFENHITGRREYCCTGCAGDVLSWATGGGSPWDNSVTSREPDDVVVPHPLDA